MADKIGGIDLRAQRGINLALRYILHQRQRIIDFYQRSVGVAQTQVGLRWKKITDQGQALALELLGTAQGVVIGTSHQYSRGDQVGATEVQGWFAPRGRR
ncbi:hypothetical protein D3C76_1631720 [compost metagenome]